MTTQGKIIAAMAAAANIVNRHAIMTSSEFDGEVHYRTIPHRRRGKFKPSIHRSKK